MNIEEIKKLFQLIEQEVEEISGTISSLKRDDQFLESAASAWTSSIGMNRSVQPDDKADPS